MAATVQALIKKGFNVYLKNNSSSFKYKIDLFAGHFSTVKGFLEAKKEDFEKLVFVIDNPNIRLTEKDYEKIKAFQEGELLDGKLSVQENFIRILTTEFVSRQLQMIDSLDLETLNVNPILASALNLNNETDLIKYYVYQAVSRSVVTSVGFLVQNLILYASEFVHEGKDDELGEQTKWDIVVEKVNEVKAYLEVKSGTNDINKYISEKEILNYFQENNYILNKVWVYDYLSVNNETLLKYSELVNSLLFSFKNQINLKITQLQKV